MDILQFFETIVFLRKTTIWGIENPIAMSLIKPIDYWDFVTRLAWEFAKGEHPYSTSLMRFRDGAKSNFPHGKTNILAIATRGRKTIMNHRRCGCILRQFRKNNNPKSYKSIGFITSQWCVFAKAQNLSFAEENDGFSNTPNGKWEKGKKKD